MTARESRQWVDAGGATFLPVCACGWRGEPRALLSRAWSEAADHGARSHGSRRQAEAARAAIERRERRRAGGTS